MFFMEESAVIDEFVLSLFFLNYIFFIIFFFKNLPNPHSVKRLKKMLRFVLTEEELQSCAQSHC